MYAVVCYFNYRKDVSFAVLKTFMSLGKADNYALRCAEDEFGSTQVVQGVAERWVDVEEVFEGYTYRAGYGYSVYSVIKIPEPEDEE